MEKVFSLETFFGIEYVNQRLAYLDHCDDKHLLRKIVISDEYWIDHMRSISDRFGFALIAQLDLADPPAFKDILRKFLFSGMIGCCYLTNRTIDALTSHGETMFTVYRMPGAHECTVITFVRPIVRHLLYHFEIRDEEFKQMIKDLCQYIYSMRFHQLHKSSSASGVPKPKEIIANWKPAKLKQFGTTMLKKIVSPYLSIAETQAFESRLESIEKMVEQE